MKWLINKKIEKILGFIDINLGLIGRYNINLAKVNLNNLLFKDKFRLVTIDIRLNEKEKEDNIIKLFLVVLFKRIEPPEHFLKNYEQVEDFGKVIITKNYIYRFNMRKLMEQPISETYEIKT